jgi:ABC-type lipoprotein release transport system permease subunit
MSLTTRLAWRNLGRNRRRSAITAAAVAFALFFAILIRSLQLGIYGHMIDTVVGGMAGYVQVADSAYWPSQNLDVALAEDPQWLEDVLADPLVASAAPRLAGFTLLSHQSESAVAQWTGVDFDLEDANFWSTRLIDGSLDEIDESGPYPVWLGRYLAESLDAHTGDTLIGMGQGYQGSIASDLMIVAGTLRLGNPELEKRVAVLRLADAQAYSGAYGRWGTIMVTPKNTSASIQVSHALAQKHPLTYASWSSWEDRMPELKQAIQADSAGGIIILFILYVVISFGLLGTMIMLANERQREFTMQIALGVKRRVLAGMVFVEALLMGLLGATVGTLMGRGLVYYFHVRPLRLMGDVASAMEQQGWEPVLPPTMDWSITWTHGAIVLLLTLLASIWPIMVVYKSPSIHR